MSSGSKAMSNHVQLIHLDDEDVGPLDNDPMVGDWTNFQEREPLAHL